MSALQIIFDSSFLSLDAMLPALAKVVDFKVKGNSLNLLDVDGNIVISLEKR